MPERQKFILLLSLAISTVLCTGSENDGIEDDYDAELRGFPEYETWKPSAHASAPEVILIKQKDPHHSDHMSFHSLMKHHLPLLAVLAPLVAVSVLLPLKAYFGPSYVVYPPVAAPAAPPPPDSKKDRVGKVEKDEEQSFAVQLMKMIDEIDKVYGETAAKDKNS